MEAVVTAFSALCTLSAASLLFATSRSHSFGVCSAFDEASSGFRLKSVVSSTAWL